jgi:hypothetical protein
MAQAAMPAGLMHAEPLLHLGALSLVICLAYLGLDRVHLEKDEFLDALERARSSTLDFVRRYDVKPGTPCAKDTMFYRFPFSVKLKFYVLCQIAGVNRYIAMGGVWRILHYAHRQLHVPLLEYFQNRRDRSVVSVFAVILLVIFLYTTAGALWELSYFPADKWDVFHWVEAERVVGPAYWICLAILLWICLSVGMTHFLKRIEDICARLQKAVDEHMKLITQDVAKHAISPPPAGAAPPASVPVATVPAGSIPSPTNAVGASSPADVPTNPSPTDEPRGAPGPKIKG